MSLSRSEQIIQIRELLAQTLLVKKPVKERILSELDTYTDEKIAKIVALLQDGNQRQKRILKRVVQEKPDIASQLDHSGFADIRNIQQEIITERRDHLKTAEEKSRTEDLVILSDIEAELAKL